MSISGYAIVLMVCPLGEACEMVAIAPQKYQTVQECQAAMQDDAAPFGLWRRMPPEGAALRWGCRELAALCARANAPSPRPLVIKARYQRHGRYAQDAVATRINNKLRRLCGPARPGGCGDEGT